MTKKRFPTPRQSKPYVLTIPKRDLPTLECELNKIQWDKVMDKDNVHDCCDERMNIVEGIFGKLLKKQNNNWKSSLPWVNDSI